MQSQSPLFDTLAKMMSEAAGAADGVRKEGETMLRSQLQRFISEYDFVPRDEFDAVRDMATKAREENDVLAAKLAELEAKLNG